MNTLKTALALASAALIAGPCLADYKQMRIAMYTFKDENYSFDPGFLARTKAMGYTHILAHWSLFNAAECDLNPNGKLQNKMKNTFLQADKSGMRYIPYVQTGSKWSGHWENCPDHGSFNTSYQSGEPNSPLYKMPPLNALSGSPIDLLYKKFLARASDAFNAAKPSLTAPFPKTLDYIHIGQDESGVNMLANGAWDTDMLLPGHPHSADRAFIENAMVNTPPYTRSGAFQGLLAKNILDWVKRVSATSGLAGTRVMIWADMWDPQHNGKAVWNSYFNMGKNITTGGVIDLPGLAGPDQSLVKSKLVLMPWQYETCFLNAPTCNSTHWDYSTSSTFNLFANKGYFFIGTMAIQDENLPITPQRWQQFKEVIANLKTPSIQSKLLGFSANTFTSNSNLYETNPRATAYWTFEYMPYWLGTRAPAVSTAIMHTLVVN